MLKDLTEEENKISKLIFRKKIFFFVDFCTSEFPTLAKDLMDEAKRPF